ncbi:MAG: tyrosine-type recombinase/integrase [Moorellaceae bacterium]
MGRRGNNEGSIRRRKDGLWEARVTLGHDPETGKLKRLSKYFKTRREAQEWLARTLHERATGTFVEPHELTLGEWLDRWLTFYKVPNRRRTTVDNYETMIRVHIKPALGHVPLMKLEASHLQEFYNQKAREKSARTVHLLHFIIGSALKQAVKEGKLYRNVNEATELPPMRKKEVAPLSAEEVRRFLDVASGDRLYAAFLLELGTGLRRGELLALKWEDIDLEGGLLKVRRTVARVKARDGGPRKTELVYQEPKTEESGKPVPIPRLVLEELRRHRARQEEEKAFFGAAYQDSGLVFCTEDGKQIDPSNFLRHYKSLLRKAGLPEASFHALRHTFATLLLEAGEDLKTVQELLRHTRIDVTADIYSHVTERLKRRASAKVDEILGGGDPSTRPT